MTESTVIRCVSCSLHTKCLIEAATFLLCSPRMYAAASLPVKNGSSEKDSKFLPPRGERCIQTVGAKRTFAPRALASSARCCPTSLMRSMFHVAAKDTPHGNSAAFSGFSDASQSRHKKAYWGSVLKVLSSRSVWSISRFDGRDTAVRKRNGPPEVCSC